MTVMSEDLETTSICEDQCKS